MTNSLNWQQRLALVSRLRLRQKLLERAASRSPETFRRNLVFSSTDRRPFELLVQPWQSADFAALDPAWQKLAGHNLQPRWQRAYIERPRGHSKTSDMALQIAWILLFSPHQLRGIAAAADRDQAALISNAIQHIARLNPQICHPLEFQRNLVINNKTGSRLEVISSDVQSSWGILPDFIICDELCHWEKPDLWHSLLSSAAKRPHCVLAILTNAGVGRGWQWNVREAARKSPRWHFSTLAGSQAPWITDDWLQEQRELLPPPVFQRLWSNIWQHSDGEFVSLAEAEACRDPNLLPQSHGQPNRHYIAAIDYAEKHDYTVGVLLHREGNQLVVDRMDVVTPTPSQTVKVSWVENWIHSTASNFHNVTFIVDEYQLLGTIQQLQSRYDIRRFEFASGKGNHALTLNLRKLITHQEIRWYPDCGCIDTPHGRDDLETELASLVLRQSASGRCRLDHIQDGTHHDDRAFALAAAALHAIESTTTPQWIESTPPTPSGNFNL